MITPRIALVLLAGALVVGAGAVAANKPPAGPGDGEAEVFFPNPVALLQDQSLTDQKDAAAAVPDGAYRPVTLTDLDDSGYLRGRWANVLSETGDPAYSPDKTFVYDRHDDRFEQVMAYYWVTQAQLYLQSLGFGAGDLRPVNRESQDLRINTWGVDNSYSWDKHDVLRFGKGGVDDAEDAEVVLHEYAHAMHDSQVAGFGVGLEAGSIGEGFADYWALTVAERVTHVTYELPCIADWDAVSYTSTTPHCLRRTDGNRVYPADLHATSVHRNGTMWSRALYDIRRALGGASPPFDAAGIRKADRIIVNAQFDFDADTSFHDAALATVAAAEAMYPGEAATHAAVCQAFVDRGFITLAEC